MKVSTSIQGAEEVRRIGKRRTRGWVVGEWGVD